MPELRVLSLGAGVQTAALALMAAKGEFGPMPDCAIFADTGDEKRGTYRYLDWLDTQLPYPIIRVRRSDVSLSESTLALYRDGSGFDQTPPFFFPGGILAKHCSKEWKTRVIIREIRRMLGVKPGKRAKDVSAQVWIGISREEAHRMAPSEAPWITNSWPLIDRNMRRSDCRRWLTDNGFPIPPRSSCVFCPYQSDEEFADMKANPTDDDWERAAGFDEAIRDGGNGTTGPLYVSSHCKPLRGVEFDRQPSLFGNECHGVCGV
jgi:hypothetical protein